MQSARSTAQTIQMLISVCFFFLLLPLPIDFLFLLFSAFPDFRGSVFFVFFAITIAKIRYLKHYLLILQTILVVSVL